MTHFFQRSARALLATTALTLIAAPLGAFALTPKYPVRLAPESVATAQPAVLLRGGDDAGELLLAATHRRHHVAAAKPAGPAATYVVKKGDTLEKISKTLGTTIDELKDANGLKKSALQPGQVLKNPNAKAAAQATTKAPVKGKKGAKPAPEPEAPPEPTTYTVRHGDTIFAIAKKSKVSVEDLRAANGLSAKAQIKSGQVLKMPGGDDKPAAKGAAAPEPAEEQVVETGRKASPGHVVTIEGKAVTYKVRRGDTLAKVAAKLGTDVATLKRDNRLKGNAITPGKVLKGPHASAKAYVAASGDTVNSVAGRFGVSAKALRAANGLSRKTMSLKSGQKIRLPAGYREAGSGRGLDMTRPSTRDYYPPVLPSTRGDQGPALPSRPQPYQPSGDAPITTNRAPSPYTVTPGSPAPSIIPSSPALSDATVSQMGKGRFIWPLQGQILSGFGPKAGGQKNDGINIQADSGAPIRAAADGTVVYAGDQVPGFGNLVLLQHSDGWVTAYGHLARIDVKNRQQITQGQQVGQAGATGGVPEPQLHFEVRYKPPHEDRASPIDPKLVLPK